MRCLRAVAASVAVCGAGPLAACGPDQDAGVWGDEFRGPACLAESRHVQFMAGGGLSLDPREQVWSIPGDGTFSSGSADAGVSVERGRAGGEQISLRQWVLRPGGELAVGAGCAPVGESACELDPRVKGARTGRVHRPAPGAGRTGGLAGFPGFGPESAPAAGWDTQPGALPTCAGAGTRAAYGGALPVGAAPLLLSGPLTGLVAGVPYAVSVVAGASHEGGDAPALRAAMVEAAGGDEAPGALDLREDELAAPAIPEWSRMTPASFPFTPDAAGGAWRLRVTAPAGAHAHCLLLGPAYITAQRGAWLAPVFDAFSDRTVWRDVEWEADQSSAETDPACLAPTPGSPITPVRVWWEAAATPPGSPRYGAPAPQPDRGTAVIPADMTGRYFRFGLTLHGRGSATDVAAGLGSRDPRLRFEGWRPVVRRLRVRYRAAEARAGSQPVLPVGLARWGRLTWSGETPGRASIAIDVLAEDGTVIAADVPRDLELSTIADPYTHPGLRLRARITGDPADPASRAVLRRWDVRWSRLPGRLGLERDTLRPGGALRGLAAVERAGRVRIRVHDAAGRAVAMLFDNWCPARTVSFVWDGRDAAGQPVQPGEYRVTVATPGGAGTRRVRVTR